MDPVKKTFFAILTSGAAFCQTDTLAVREFNDKIAVQVFALNTSNDFTVHYDPENLDINIVPNQKTTLNVGVQYDIVSFSLGFAPQFFAENRDNQDSKMIAFGTTIYPQKFVQKFELYYQKGMTIEEATTKNGLYLANLKSMKIGGSTSFAFNRNFSFRAINLQNAQQMRSEGSFTPGISYYYTTLDGRKQPELGDKTYFVDVAIEPAYYYNWVIGRHFLLASGISLGAGISWTVDDKTYTSALYKGSLMLAPGFNADRWFGGAYARVQVANHDSDANTAIGDAIGYTALFIGYRFDAPGFVSREKDRIKDKMKL